MGNADLGVGCNQCAVEISFFGRREGCSATILHAAEHEAQKTMEADQITPQSIIIVIRHHGRQIKGIDTARAVEAEGDVATADRFAEALVFILGVK